MAKNKITVLEIFNAIKEKLGTAVSKPEFVALTPAHKQMQAQHAQWVGRHRLWKMISERWDEMDQEQFEEQLRVCCL